MKLDNILLSIKAIYTNWNEYEHYGQVPHQLRKFMSDEVFLKLTKGLVRDLQKQTGGVII